MLTSNQKKRATARAQALESACSALAADLFCSTDLCTDADDGYETMQAILTRAFRTAAEKWNRTHDRLSALPTELRCMCWSYLPTRDMLRLASICRSWRDLSRTMPLLWTSLRLSGQRPGLQDLLSLSASLPLALALLDCLPSQLRDVDESLRTHADRLKSLRLSVTGDYDIDIPDDNALFLYPAPRLQNLTLRMSLDVDWCISPDLFKGCSPQLRSATLCNVMLPTSCAALSRLTRLRLENNCGPLDLIYDIAPVLEELELAHTSHLRSLPSVPTASRLSKVAFSARTQSFTRLLAGGYVGGPELAVSVRFSLEPIRSAACLCPPSFRSALTITDTGLTTLVLRQESGHSASFVTTDAPYVDVCDLLHGGSAFHTLEHLILPAELDNYYLSTDEGEATAYPYIPDGGLALPALRTLTILCAPRRLCSLMDRNVACGRLTAPLLSRLELSRDTEAESAGDSVDACDLVLFIERRIACDAPGALEVRIDSARGVRLECAHIDGGEDEAADGLARLRAGIGKLILW